ncbi:uncharacterized protein A4U43_C10F13850 [Asparagus officinalis]|uniref:RING-CH-type domain-containing protein n=1 Tax=Asparagus officinalis TaxID=4686 RepID=A0A5P1E2W3_ASPOF|nr:uncharacterized protein A4U43_C10F13850 [Asparagus officinalis]
MVYYAEDANVALVGLYNPDAAYLSHGGQHWFPGQSDDLGVLVIFNVQCLPRVSRVYSFIIHGEAIVLFAYVFAHRKCIQRWCNKKGNITCEICNQVYAPNYSAPPTRSSSDMIAIDIRQGWAGARIDLNNSHFLAIAAAEQELLNAEYEHYAAAHNNGIACCRSVALILMFLLLVHHVLMVIRDVGMVHDASDFFNLSLQFAGFLLPCYLIVRSCYLLQGRRRRQA